MPDIFTNQPGGVLRVTTAALSPFTISVDGLEDYTQQNCVITALGLRQSGGFQFLHTLRKFVYVYTFGERIADMIVSGICFQTPCDRVPQLPMSGFERALAFYNTHSINQNPDPVTIAIGSTIGLLAFLTEIDLAHNDNTHNTGQFTMKFNYFPGA